MTTLVPFLTDSYDEIFEQERADLQQIRSEYQHYYDATDAAFASADANILAFLAFPTASLTGKFVSTAPKAAKGILSVLTGGLSDKSLGGSKSPSRVFDSYAREYNLLLLQEADQDSLSNKIKSKKFIEMMLQKSPIASSAASAALELHSRMLGERVKPILDIYDAKSLDDLNKTLGSKIEIPDEKELDPKAKLSAADAQRKFLDAAKSTAQKAAIEQLKKYVEPVRKTFGSDHPFVQNYDAVIDAISSGNASQVAQVKKQLGLTQSEQ
jgi:hypothetical protein